MGKLEKNSLKYLIALLHIPKIGNKHAKNLIAYCGSAEAVFKQKKTHLQKIPGIGNILAQNIASFSVFDEAEKELEFIEKNKIKPIAYLDPEYPRRLKELEDSPLIMYYRGSANLDSTRMIAVVGTRKPTEYGKMMTAKLVEELSEFDVTIVSGLAYGVDTIAHKTAVKAGLPTIGVLGHGLDMLYPAQNRHLAAEMVNGKGGLLTEYPSGTNPDKENFPQRNRIVAGITDATLIVESSKKGGALITGEIAFSYNREVFAVPGRSNDEMSAGCNHFIRLQKAFITENVEDIAYQMGWKGKEKNKPKPQLSLDLLLPEERKIMEVLRSSGKMNIDSLCIQLEMTNMEASMILLDLEFRGAILALPGKLYQAIL
jgi:DNA processing protein